MLDLADLLDLVNLVELLDLVDLLDLLNIVDVYKGRLQKKKVHILRHCPNLVLDLPTPPYLGQKNLRQFGGHL